MCARSRLSSCARRTGARQCVSAAAKRPSVAVTCAVDQYGQVIDVLLSVRRDAAAAGRFFTRALRTLMVKPIEVVADAAPVYPAVLEKLVPAAWHHVERYENNPIEADHGQLKRRLRPMRGLQTDRTAQVVIAGHAFVQNLRRGHYDVGLGTPLATRLAAAFNELARAVGAAPEEGSSRPPTR
jgi:hypothetical protein